MSGVHRLLSPYYLGPASDEVPARPTQGGDEGALYIGDIPCHWAPNSTEDNSNRREICQGAGGTHRCVPTIFHKEK